MRVIVGILVRDLASMASVELIESALGNAVKQFLGVDAQEVPSKVEGLLDGARLVGRLADESALEFLEELERELVFRREGVFSYDGFHGGWLDWLVRDITRLGKRKILQLRGDFFLGKIAYRHHDQWRI